MVNALWIVLLGIAVMFAVLGILLLVIALLSKLIRPQKKERVNPMIGACGLSDLTMSSGVVQKLGLVVNPYNHLLIHTAGADIAG